MSDTMINNVRVPFVPVRGVDSSPQRIPVGMDGKETFQNVFEKELDELKFSKHAQQRLDSRSISLNDADKMKLQNAVSMAEQKGSNDSLVFLRDMAFIVSVKNRTVVTAIDKANLQQNVFTNIDSAVIAE
ncbi:MAG: flagellar protein [Bacteroidetes bacterium]|nr:flagellar protein [Bacteroidota bacterium]